MRIINRRSADGDRERITVVPDTVDDLWHLAYIIEPGDFISGDTSRRIQSLDDSIRDTGGVREHLSLTLSVSDIEFHKFANRLRVGGEIVSCSREDQIGHHHTINVDIYDEITIEKSFQTDQNERLNEAVEATERPTVAIVTIEEGQAYIHTIAQYGTEEYASISGPTGKGEFARSRSELFAKIADAIDHLEVDSIIFAGPGFTKEDAFSYIRDNRVNLVDNIRLVDTSSVGDRGVHEVLKRGEIDTVQTEIRIAKEASLIDDLMKQISDGGKAAYGFDSVWKAAEYGAIDRLLVVDERVRRERIGEGDWPIDVNELLETVDQQGGDITLFSSDFEPAQQLHNLGDVAAILRYPID